MNKETMELIDGLKLNGRIKKILKADIPLEDKKVLLEAEKVDTLNCIYIKLRQDEDVY